MRRPSFCSDVRFGLSKLTSQLGKDVAAGVFPLTCNFTDALLLSLNSLRLAGKGLTEIGFFLNVPTVMRPCDGTSGLARGNRRKAVFAFKGLFPADFVAVFASGRSELSCCGSAGKKRGPPSTTGFSATKSQVAEV